MGELIWDLLSDHWSVFNQRDDGFFGVITSVCFDHRYLILVHSVDVFWITDDCHNLAIPMFSGALLD